MHICPQEIMAFAALATVGVGGYAWVRWKWAQFKGRLASAFSFMRR